MNTVLCMAGLKTKNEYDCQFDRFGLLLFTVPCINPSPNPVSIGASYPNKPLQIIDVRIRVFKLLLFTVHFITVLKV